MRKNLFIIFLSTLFFSSHSQNIDSLLKELSKAKIDSTKFNILMKVCDYYENEDQDVMFKYLQDALKITIKTKNRFKEAATYVRMGSVYTTQDRFDTAATLFEKAKTIFVELKNFSKEADMKLNIAVMKKNMGSTAEALKEFNDALIYYKDNNKPEREGMCYSNIADVYDTRGELNKAVEYLLKAITVYEKNNLESRKARSMNELGNVLRQKRDYKKALEYAFAALKIREGAKDNVGMGSTYTTLGNIYAEMGDNKTAAKYMRKCVELYTKLNMESGVAVAYNNLGNVYETINLDSSLYFFEEALKIHRTFQNPSAVASCLSNLGRIYQAKKNYKASYAALKEAEEICLKTDNRMHLIDVYNLTSHYYYETGNFQKAYDYLSLHTLMNDSVLNIENNKQVKEMEGKYQNEKKTLEIDNLQKEASIQESEIKRQNAYKLTFAIGFGLMLILSVVIFRSYRQKKNDNKIISFQKELVEEKQKEIVDSINYAKRIQNTLLAHNSLLNENLPEYFVFFNPKDIVSGDFYWATKKGNKFYLAVCDSTGHGVPGAFMSLLNISFLNEAINEKNIEAPNEVFNYVRERLIANVSQEGAADGMDGILLCIDGSKITYATANNAPILISNNEITELPKDKMPIGKGERMQSFNLYSINANKGDMLYLYTDGFADQFGGPKGKKYKYKQLNDLLLSVSSLSMNGQKEKVREDFYNWKGNVQQIDDVCVIGIKLS